MRRMIRTAGPSRALRTRYFGGGSNSSAPPRMRLFAILSPISRTTAMTTVAIAMTIAMVYSLSKLNKTWQFD